MLIEELYMNLGQCIKKVREAKGLALKEVAAAAKMDTANYWRIENGKTDPTFSLVVRIAKALNIEPYELLRADSLFKEANSLDKSLQEKLLLTRAIGQKRKRIKNPKTLRCGITKPAAQLNPDQRTLILFFSFLMQIQNSEGEEQNY